MTLEVGRRVKLTADVVLPGPVTLAGSDPAAPVAVAGSLGLASGTEGTVERVNDGRNRQPQPSHEVDEYLRLTSLLADYGHHMPPASRKHIDEHVASLKPAWIAYQGQQARVTVRVRLDNGFVLDDAQEDLFTSA
ncbi:hypothetical protein [Streptomyces sp. NPDC091371]|uniref:hypothetical protein n=1 Tax=Streptomyces sp. NPDC091371 TaxID=3155303 RepID=UPI003445A170